MLNMNEQWRIAVSRVLNAGVQYAPRGKPILEIPHGTVRVSMDYPVLTIRGRKLNYKFMAAEAAWIVSGSNSLAGHEEVAKRLAPYSDDGLTLAGAYGPMFSSQLTYVASKIAEDHDTRQATMTIWRPCPAPSKDTPCTVAMDFKLRDGRLNSHVFMRSSDVWLGLPYDVFSFTMMACRVIEYLALHYGLVNIRPGVLYLTAASSHLYAEHLEAARSALVGPSERPYAPLPAGFYDPTRIGLPLISRLNELAKSKPRDGARFWELNEPWIVAQKLNKDGEI